jgi:hypothetical protein
MVPLLYSGLNAGIPRAERDTATLSRGYGPSESPMRATGCSGLRREGPARAANRPTADGEEQNPDDHCADEKCLLHAVTIAFQAQDENGASMLPSVRKTTPASRLVRARARTGRLSAVHPAHCSFMSAKSA